MDSIFGAGCEVDQKLNSEKYFFLNMLSRFLMVLQIRILINPFYALCLLVNHIIKESSPLSVNIKDFQKKFIV